MAENVMLTKLIKIGSSIPLGIAVTSVIMVALAFIVNIFNVPNPNMVLISGLVVCSAAFGASGGVTGALIMMAYTLSFFSTNHDFVTFTPIDSQKVVVSAIGITVTTVFVSTLRHITTKAFRQLEQMNEELEEDNRLLEEASAIDTLTNARNRFGLRRDFPEYVNKNLHVMMLDIDDFKDLNDTYGHQAGDYVLSQIGSCLVNLCSQDHVYRYGGDEFLIICPDATPQEFEQKSRELMQQVKGIRAGNDEETVRISIGYVYGTPVMQSDLRMMMRQADGNLYESKNAGKNRITGCAYSREAAQQAKSHQEHPVDTRQIA